MNREVYVAFGTFTTIDREFDLVIVWKSVNA